MNRRFSGVRAVALLGGAIFAGGLTIWLVVTSHMAALSPPSPPVPAPRNVTRAPCADCHAEPARLWAGSHHDRALEPAAETTMLGAFDGKTLEHFGQTSRFFRRGKEYWVETQDARGKSSQFQVVYSAGVQPLQQYLVEGPRGRLQVLPFGWDTRPPDQGGSRWFPIYPSENILPGDALHWTGPSFTWNAMCAECHSTDLEKRYDVDRDSFNTTWRWINVNCEACHGRGDAHAVWVQERAAGQATSRSSANGLRSSLHRAVRKWELLPGQRIASPNGPSASTAVLAACSPCHSRRTPIRAVPLANALFLENYVPSLIREPLYFPDGQMRDEVYEWGSFLQSKMHAAGVTCVDCHDPHSLEVRAQEGAEVCQKCHQPEYYTSAQHHFHKPGGAGSSCVACHMPERLYMVVDARRDHSLRVPRPDLTIKLQTPNACNGCHTDQSAEWAERAIERWYPAGRWREPHFGEAFARAEAGDPSAASALIALASSPAVAPIVRASATEHLQAFLNVDSRVLPAVVRAAQEEDPLLRLGAAIALSGLGPSSILLGAPVLETLCKDAVAAVAVEAGRSAAAIRALLPGDRYKVLKAAIERTLLAERVQAEFPLNQYNAGGLLLALERTSEAEVAYRRALAGMPSLVPALLDLADLLRATGRDEEAEPLLRRASSLDTEQSSARVALGLWLVRHGRTDEALRELKLAAEAKPESSRAAYVYGVALESGGDSDSALKTWEKGLTRHPFDRELRLALLDAYRKQGRGADAERALTRFRDMYPHDPELSAMGDP